MQTIGVNDGGWTPEDRTLTEVNGSHTGTHPRCSGPSTFGPLMAGAKLDEENLASVLKTDCRLSHSPHVGLFLVTSTQWFSTA
jgi:hypothetical protein